MFNIGARDIERAHINGVDRHFYINDGIENADDYIDLIDALYQGKPNENVCIHLNTPGGRLDIAMQIINAIKASDANVVGMADGEVASAGSMILFACPNIAIMPYSYVMIHDGGEGNGGKLNENLKRALFSANLIKKIYYDVYIPFFSKEEIDMVLEGKDMWITAEEVTERINKVANPPAPVEEEVVQKPKRKVKDANK